MAYRSSSQNNASSDTPGTTVPTGAAANDIAILFFSIDFNNLGALPAGFVSLTTDTMTFDGEEYQVAWKRLTAADTGSYTMGSIGSAHDWITSCLLFSGRDTTNPPVISAVNKADSSHTGTISIPATAVTASTGDDIAYLGGTDQNNNGAALHTFSAPASYTLRTSPQRAWEGHMTATRDNVSGGSTGTVTGQDVLATGAEGIIGWLIRIPASGGTQTGVIAISGAGSVAVAGAVSESGSIAPSGSGLVAVAGSVSESGAIAVSAAGAVVVDGVKGQISSVAVVEAGSVGVGQAQSELGTVSVGGAGVVSLAGVVAESGSVSVSGAGAVAVAGAATKTGSVAVSGAGSVSVAGVASETGVIAVQGAGSVAIGGLATKSGAIASNGQGAVTVGSQGLQTGSIAPTGAASVTVAGSVQEIGTITPTGAGLVTVASAGGLQSGSVAVSGLSAVAVGPSITKIGSIAVTATGAVAVTPSHTVPVTVTIIGTELVTIAGTQQGNVPGVIAISGSALVTITSVPSGEGILEPLSVEIGAERWPVALGESQWVAIVLRERWRTMLGVDHVKKSTIEHLPLLIDTPRLASIATVEFILGQTEAVPASPTWLPGVSDSVGNWFAPVGPFSDVGTWWVNVRITASNGEQPVRTAGYVQVEA